MRKTFQRLVTEYGVTAAIVYFTIFFGVWVASWAAIQRGVDLPALAARMGFSPNGFVTKVGAWGAAYLFTKLLQPLRIGATVVLTPIVAKLYERVAAKGPASRSAPPPEQSMQDRAPTDQSAP